MDDTKDASDIFPPSATERLLREDIDRLREQHAAEIIAIREEAAQHYARLQFAYERLEAEFLVLKRQDESRLDFAALSIGVKTPKCDGCQVELVTVDGGKGQDYLMCPVCKKYSELKCK